MTETTKKNIEDAVLSKLGELLKSGAEEFYLNVNIQPGWALMLIPRSSRGADGLVITNTIGLIDSDYRGEIRAFMKNDNSYHSLRINEGEKYMQGVFVPYGIAANDETTAERTGGVGSTGL